MSEALLVRQQKNRVLGPVPELTGLRGVAIAMVLLFHAFPHRLTGGFLGVDVFFALSGFLITALLLSEWDTCGRISYAGFYGRRFFRLYPALLALLIVVSAVSALTNWAPHTISGAWAVLTYRSNLVLASGGHFPAILEHTWSLALEEQFYVIWPVVLLLLLKTVRQPKAIMAITGLLGLGSSLVRLGLDLAGHGQQMLYYAPWTHADPILYGCLAGQLFVWGPAIGRRPRRFCEALGLTAGMVLILLVVRLRTSAPFTYRAGIALAGIASALLIWSLGQQAGGPLSRILRASALVRLGVISYSVYLWHYPVLVWVHEHVRGATPIPQLLGLGLSVVFGELSYRFVEQPWLAMKRRLPGYRSEITKVMQPAASAPASTPLAPPPRNR